MIFDGVLERFPELRIGVIEQGAIWVPSWMRQMESAFEAFHRHEERLQALSLRPSEYVRRQVRFTPYPTEDVGWIIEQAGPEVCLFSSDYPHVEGGRQPDRALRGQSLGDASERGPPTPSTATTSSTSWAPPAPRWPGSAGGRDRARGRRRGERRARSSGGTGSGAAPRRSRPA